MKKSNETQVHITDVRPAPVVQPGPPPRGIDPILRPPAPQTQPKSSPLALHAEVPGVPDLGGNVAPSGSGGAVPPNPYGGGGYIPPARPAPAPAAPAPPAPHMPPPSAVGTVQSFTGPFGTLSAGGMAYLGPSLAAALAPVKHAPPSAIGTIGGAPPPAPPPIPIDAPVPPTITLGQGQDIVGGAAAGDPQAIAYLQGTVDAAHAGDYTAYANGAVLSIAARLQTMAAFVAQYVGPEAARDILTGVHLT